MIDVKSKIGQELNQLWEDFKEHEFCQYPPLAIDAIESKELIFVGINPSLSENQKKDLGTKTDQLCEYYPHEPNKEKNHRYFKKFHDISERTKLSWTHFDLLYIRETQQKRINSLLKTSAGIEFVYGQLMLTKQLMDSLLTDKKSKIFVVNNTLAREFLGKDRPSTYSDDQEHWMNYKFEWDENIGTYRLDHHVFFFTSMLTGQRALDNGSYERLIWHIKMVKKTFASSLIN